MRAKTWCGTTYTLGITPTLNSVDGTKTDSTQPVSATTASISTGSRWKSLEAHVQESGHDIPIVDSERYVSYRFKDLWPEWQERAHCAGTGWDNYFGTEADD